MSTDRLPKITIITTAVFLAAFLCAQAADIFSYKKQTITVDNKKFHVLIADTLEKREQGLSAIEPKDLMLHGVDGMLFIFEDSGERVFQAWYMKFDLILLGLERTPGGKFIVIDRQPLNVGTIARIRGKYVLELPAQSPDSDK